MNKPIGKILIVEDDRTYAERLMRNLEREGFDADFAMGAKEALEALSHTYYDLVVTDIKMPDIDGIELIHTIKQGECEGIDPEIPIVALTSVNTIQTAVEAIKEGAADYITKECEHKEIVLRILKVLDQAHLINENRYLRERLARVEEFADIVGDSPSIKRIKQEIVELSGSSVTVLILGETGVGKELVARAIHNLGPRRDKPFVDINCASLPTDNLFQSEVFGHEKGAFTDAKEMKRGRFELAQEGTLFLDEISELSLESQAKILKVIETNEFIRLGGLKVIKVNTRFLFASNRDLKQMVKEKKFRQDLYFRINVYPLEIQPLRQRRQDIPLLAIHYLREFCRRYRKEPKRISPKGMEILSTYEWEGNVRELKNIMERLSLRSREVEITEGDMKLCGIDVLKSQTITSNVTLPDEGIKLEEWEKDLILEALRKSNWNQKRAAELLGISVDRMNFRVKKFGITHPSWRVHKEQTI